MKVNQLRIKIYLYINRIMNIQKMYRHTINTENFNREALMDLMQKVLNQVSQLFLQNKKTLQSKYPHLLSEISQLDMESKSIAAQELLVVSKYRHTIDLMRWYGKF